MYMYAAQAHKTASALPHSSQRPIITLYAATNSTMPTRYPSHDEVKELCSHLGTPDPAPFFDRVSPDVEWDVLGE